VIRIPSRAQEPKLLLTNPGGPGSSSVVDLRSNREYINFATARDPEKPKRLAEIWAVESPISGASRAWSLEDTLTAFLMKGELPPDRVYRCPPNT
jgi:hypothetical protein